MVQLQLVDEQGDPWAGEEPAAECAGCACGDNNFGPLEINPFHQFLSQVDDIQTALRCSVDDAIGVWVVYHRNLVAPIHPYGL